ncbi:MAG: GGDEF domain-containing protein [Candidatus Eremiobacteraeota bacterium]|nr:GGDEF domain-containing protein [Candidatus Eremiobacteraeota bacterium]
MKDGPTEVRTSVPQTFWLEDTLATPQQRAGAAVFCVALVLVTVLAATFGSRVGPKIAPFVSITATIWSLAYLHTAFLLLARFSVNGKVTTVILAVAYAFSGLMTWSYVAAFPGLFRTGVPTVADEQLSSVAWLVWHCMFPALAICATLNDGSYRRIVSRRTIAYVTAAAAVLPILLTCAISAAVFAYRDALPHLIVARHFQPVYAGVILPAVVALNLVASIVLVGARRSPRPIAIWLAVTTFSAACDTIMVARSFAVYSYSWDIGKIMTVVTASIVLSMILVDIAGLYGRLSRAARTDPLTGLRNRRACEEHFELVANNARRTRGRLAVLSVDVDFFKLFNDSHGHLAGDECLRHVARQLEACATRPLDLVARYGGEEFIVILPDTPLRGVFIVAERIRSSIERLPIPHDQEVLPPVTVSIGIGYASDARAGSANLFEAADRALYDAKNGRNRVALAATGGVPPQSAAPVERSAATSTNRAAS